MCVRAKYVSFARARAHALPFAGVRIAATYISHHLTVIITTARDDATRYLLIDVCVLYVCMYDRYDTVHGVYDGEVSHDGENLIVDGTKIKVILVFYTFAFCALLVH